MTRQAIIDFCLALPAVYEDYPFDDDGGAEGAWTVMRHRTGKKTFAMIYQRRGKLCVNLKCEPIQAELLRQIYADVTPGYHMNKQHWNTITLGGDVSDAELCRQIEASYALTQPQLRKGVFVVEMEYNRYLIETDVRIVNAIAAHQRAFDRWLYDENNDHGYWVDAPGGVRGVCYGIEAFVTWLNDGLKPKKRARVIGTEPIESTAFMAAQGAPLLYF